MSSNPRPDMNEWMRARPQRPAAEAEPPTDPGEPTPDQAPADMNEWMRNKAPTTSE